MFRLKNYQQRTLDILQAYFADCLRTGDADTAFYGITRSIFNTGIPYRSVEELPGLPYVCLRIPTGGGKTLVASHAVGVAAKHLLLADHTVVLWLVPSNAIREQTLKALKEPRHPYRQAIETEVGSVTVLDIAEALFVQRSTLDSDTTIIVSTMQAFRVEDTEGRRVYESAGGLMAHFTGVDDALWGGLERREDSSISYSLANVLRVRRPIVIVDEAHNARTSLSFGTLARFNPACIIEFTATPDTAEHPSNVLYSVSAAELKTEAMIKMPILLETRLDWKELVAEAVGLQGRLEEIARLERRETGEYIRPIMLIQAESNRRGRDSVTVDVVERCLLEDHRIPAGQIVRATGTEHGLEGIDILSPACEIRFVITMQALREGWDCPFAYVLCSVAQVGSSTAVEQILGRIMRLPKATRKAHDELNNAYAFTVSHSFAAAANALTDALVEFHGYNRQEARDLITHREVFQTELPFEEPDLNLNPTYVIVAEAPRVDELPESLRAKVVYDAVTGRLSLRGTADIHDRYALEKCFSTPEARLAVEQLYRRLPIPSTHRPMSPSERGQRFSVPQLAIKQGDLFEVFEETHFLSRAWSLSACSALLTEAEFPSERLTGQQGEITVSDTGRIEARFLSTLRQQMTLLDREKGWTAPELVYWLDRTIPHPDITPTESGNFLIRAIRSLIDERGLDQGRLVRDKYRLRQALAAKIEQHRAEARRASYQALLLPECETPLMVTPDVCCSFPPSDYPYSTRYDGPYVFKKHYYPHVGNLTSVGEEFECAQFLDSLPEVKFWVRNLERRPSHSFWLQTSTDKFYPDFVCLLNDGRYLVVESKGEHLWSNDDSKEKRDIGGLWEARSHGECLFVMPRGQDFNAIKAKINGQT